MLPIESCTNTLSEVSLQLNLVEKENSIRDLSSILTKLKEILSSHCLKENTLNLNQLSNLLNRIKELIKYQKAGCLWSDPHTAEILCIYISILDQLRDFLYEETIVLDILSILSNLISNKLNIESLLTDFLNLFIKYAEYYTQYPNKFLDSFNQIKFSFDSFSNQTHSYYIKSKEGLSNSYLKVFMILSNALNSLDSLQGNKTELDFSIYREVFNLLEKSKNDFFSKFLVRKYSDRLDEATVVCKKLSDWCEVNSVTDPLPFQEQLSNGRYIIQIKAAHSFDLLKLSSLIDATYRRAFEIFRATLDEQDKIILHIFANKTHFVEQASFFGFSSEGAGHTLIDKNICRIAIYLQNFDKDTTIFLNAPHEWLHCLLGRESVETTIHNINKLPATVYESIPEFIQNGILEYYSPHKQLNFKHLTRGAVSIKVINDFALMNFEKKDKFLFNLLQQKKINSESYVSATLLAAYLIENNKWMEIIQCAKPQDSDQDKCLWDFSDKYTKDFIKYLTHLVDENDFTQDHKKITLINPNPSLLVRLGLGLASGMSYGLVKALFEIYEEKSKTYKQKKTQLQKTKRLLLSMSQILINSAIQSTYVFSLSYPDRLGIPNAGNDGFLSNTGVYFAMGLTLELIMSLVNCNKKLKNALSYLFLLYPWIMLCFSEDELLEKFYTLLLSTVGNFLSYFGLKKLFYVPRKFGHECLQDQNLPLIESQIHTISEDFLDIKHLINLTDKHLNLFQVNHTQNYKQDIGYLLNQLNIHHYDGKKELYRIQGNLNIKQKKAEKYSNHTHLFKIWLENIEQRFLLLDSKKEFTNNYSPYLSEIFKKKFKADVFSIWTQYEFLIKNLIENKNDLNSDFLEKLINVDKAVYDVMLVIHIKKYLERVELYRIREILQPIQQSSVCSEKKPKTTLEREKAAREDLQATLNSINTVFDFLQSSSTGLGCEKMRSDILLSTKKIMQIVQNLIYQIKTESNSLSRTGARENSNRFSFFSSNNTSSSNQRHIYDTPQEIIYSNINDETRRERSLELRSALTDEAGNASRRKVIGGGANMNPVRDGCASNAGGSRPDDSRVIRTNFGDTTAEIFREHRNCP